MIYVFIEQQNNIIPACVIEMLRNAKIIANKLNTKVVAVLPGHNIKLLLKTIYDNGADEVIYIDNKKLNNYSAQIYAEAIYEAVNAEQIKIFMFSATSIGKDISKRISAKFKSEIISKCMDIKIGDNNNLYFTLSHDNDLIQEVFMDDCQISIVEMLPKKSDILIAGGRGLGSKENFVKLYELAGLLKGKVVSSRPPVDNGWIGPENQVGTTGKVVSPKIYLAFGISGALQHIEGIEKSDIIISINNNTTAPIFEISDIAIVGDARTILPKLIKSIKNN